MSDSPADVTAVLRAYSQGSAGAFDRLFDLVYNDLRRVAQGQLNRLRAPIDATDLVHEMYMKVAGQESLTAQDRGHFFAIAARAMRQVLVDHARNRLAAKRGAGEHHTGLDKVGGTSERSADEVIAVHQVLDRLGALDPRLIKIVECRYFAGFTEGETASALGVSVRTVQRDWKRARAWLHEEIAG